MLKKRNKKKVKRNRCKKLAVVLFLSVGAVTLKFNYNRTNDTTKKAVVGTMVEVPTVPELRSGTIYTTTTPTTTSTMTVTTTVTTTSPPYISDTREQGYYSQRLDMFITNQDMDLLTLIACSEAGVEPYEGKVAVVATVLNRLVSEDFPDSIYDVIFQEEQFSSAYNGRFYSRSEELTLQNIPEDTFWKSRKAVQAALDGEDPTAVIGGALYFFNPEYCSDEELSYREEIMEKVQIYSHIFYRVWD